MKHPLGFLIIAVLLFAGSGLHGRQAPSAGADTAQRVREDGSKCFRAAIEQNVASARRLHFWRLPDGSIELSRVVVHDDFKP